MTCTPSELYEIGTNIANAASDDASRRAAVSRLYYAAYHACRDFHHKLPSPGSVGQANGRHEQLCEQLRTPTFSKNNDKYLLSIVLAKSLRLVLSSRILADYKINMDLQESYLKEVLEHCETVLAKTGFYPPVQDSSVAAETSV